MLPSTGKGGLWLSLHGRKPLGAASPGSPVGRHAYRAVRDNFREPTAFLSGLLLPARGPLSEALLPPVVTLDTFLCPLLDSYKGSVKELWAAAEAEDRRRKREVSRGSKPPNKEVTSYGAEVLVVSEGEDDSGSRPKRQRRGLLDSYPSDLGPAVFSTRPGTWLSSNAVEKVLEGVTAARATLGDGWEPPLVFLPQFTEELCVWASRRETATPSTLKACLPVGKGECRCTGQSVVDRQWVLRAGGGLGVQAVSSQKKRTRPLSRSGSSCTAGPTFTGPTLPSTLCVGKLSTSAAWVSTLRAR